MKLRWGILSTAKIGIEKVIPAIQKASNCEVVAIASRNIDTAKNAASLLGIPKAYGTYEALLSDPNIDAIYNPLPNHFHVPYTIKALEAGKHVLCEKPIALDANQAALLVAGTQKFPQLKVMEAFMYRFHPQWKKVKELVSQDTIGEVKAIQTFFSFFNNDPKDIRNQLDLGGGSLMDIGCYCIQFPRFIIGVEPLRVISLINRNPNMKTDVISSAMLDFGNGVCSSFTCSTQLQPFQRTQIVGTKGRIEIEMPVNAPAERLLKVSLFTHDLSSEMFIGPADQYTLQVEAFTNAVHENKPVPTPLTDAVYNMKVIDALFESEKNSGWVIL